MYSNTDVHVCLLGKTDIYIYTCSLTIKISHRIKNDISKYIFS